MTPETTTEAASTAASVGLTHRPERAPSSAAGRILSPQQLGLLLSFSTPWLRAHLVPLEDGRYHEPEVVQWLNQRRLCGQPFRFVPRMVSPSECAEWFPGHGSATAWRRRMAQALLPQTILTVGGEYRAALHAVAQWLDG